MCFVYLLDEGTIVRAVPLRSLALEEFEIEEEALSDGKMHSEEQHEDERQFQRQGNIDMKRNRVSGVVPYANSTNIVTKNFPDAMGSVEVGETIVEIISRPSKRPVSRDIVRRSTISSTESITKETQNLTKYEDDLQQLVEEARITKAKIDQLNEELGKESDSKIDSESKNFTRINITSYNTTYDKQYSKNKKRDSVTQQLTEQINIEREVRRQLLSHLVKVQVEDQAREEALEEILRHHPLKTEELQQWNITQRALKSIVKARINILEPSDRIKIVNQIQEFSDELSKRNRITKYR